MINRIIGTVLLICYGYVLLNKEKYAPGLQVLDENKHLHYRAAEGFEYVVMLPLVGIACLIMPTTFSELFSPKYGLFRESLLTPGFFVIVGYLCILVGYGLWALFM
jgi:H+/gluconate symporter-like permease